MSESCRPIAELPKTPKGEFGNVTADVAKLDNVAGSLSDCDIEKFRKELNAPYSVEEFWEYAGRGKDFSHEDAGDVFMETLFEASRERQQFFFNRYLNYAALTELVTAIAKKIKTIKYNDPFFDKQARKIEILRRVITDPAYTQWLEPAELQGLKYSFKKADERLQDKDVAIESQLAGLEMAVVNAKEKIAKRADERLRYLEMAGFVFNCIRQGLLVLSGFAIKTNAGGIAGAAAAAAFGIGDIAGEQIMRAFMKDDYTWRDALLGFARQAPFELIRGASIKYSPTASVTMFAGSQFLETLLKPSDRPVSPWRKFLDATGDACISLVVFAGGKFLGGKIAPFVGKRLRGAPKVLKEASPPPRQRLIKTPPPSESNIGSPGPQQNGHNRRERVWQRIPESGKAGRAGSGKTTPQQPTGLPISTTKSASGVRHRVSHTDYAKDCFRGLARNQRQRHQLGDFVVTLRRKLNEGVLLRDIANTKHVREYKFWEGFLLTPAKPRVYFRVIGNGGEKRTLEILGYSLGERGQRNVMEQIQRFLSQTTTLQS